MNWRDVRAWWMLSLFTEYMTLGFKIIRAFISLTIQCLIGTFMHDVGSWIPKSFFKTSSYKVEILLWKTHEAYVPKAFLADTFRNVRITIKIYLENMYPVVDRNAPITNSEYQFYCFWMGSIGFSKTMPFMLAFVIGAFRSTTGCIFLWFYFDHYAIIVNRSLLLYFACAYVDQISGSLFSGVIFNPIINFPYVFENITSAHLMSHIWRKTYLWNSIIIIIVDTI